MNILFNPLKFIPFLLIDKQLIYLLSLGEFFLCNNNLIIHKMDIINHALSGLVVANLTCETVEQKALVVMGSILPDIFFSPFYLYLSKKTGKTIYQLKEKDFVTWAGIIQPWRKIYLWTHSLVLLLMIFLTKVIFYQSYFLAMGIGLHIFYDLLTHKYEDKKLNPVPMYPFSNWSFDWGLTNDWRLGNTGRIIFWLIHSLILYWVIYFELRNYAI